MAKIQYNDRFGFNVLGNDESFFGLTGKRNPYTLKLIHNSPK